MHNPVFQGADIFDWDHKKFLIECAIIGQHTNGVFRAEYLERLELDEYEMIWKAIKEASKNG